MSNTSSNFLQKLGVPNENFIEVEPKYINKVFISGITEGYGFLNHTKKLMEDINPKKLYPIVDGFLQDKNDFLPIPPENVYVDARLNFWWVWNVLWNFNPKYRTYDDEIDNPMTGSKGDWGHNGTIKSFIKPLTSKRKHKFMCLNNNNKTGREIFIDEISDKLIEENWISGYFSDRVGLKNIDKVDPNNPAPPNMFYSKIFFEHYDRCYIQPFFESPGLNDGFTDKMLMVTEKSCIPFLLGNIAIPMNLFYVSEYEKLGFKFVKNINGVSINETIEWDIEKYKMDSDIKSNDNFPTKFLRNNIKSIEKINNESTLDDLEKVWLENIDIIEHNRELVIKYMTSTECLDDLKEWLEK
tara:strand:- start:2601 stop:3665 length:1065 start_codon:yes stop_codon:yes gene_type:complete